MREWKSSLTEQFFLQFIATAIMRRVAGRMRCVNFLSRQGLQKEEPGFTFGNECCSILKPSQAAVQEYVHMNPGR